MSQVGSVGNPLSLTAPGRRLSSQGDMDPQIQPDSRSNGCCPPNPRQPPSQLGRVRPHPWVWRRDHWPVLSTACLPHVNLPAPRPPQAVGRLRQPLEPDHTLGQVSRLCVCHPGPTVDRNPHRLGERGEEWRGWRPGPGLPHACHQHLSTIQRMDIADGALAVFGVPSAGRGESRRAQDGARVDGARPYPLLAATSPSPGEDLQDLLGSSESCGD